MRLLKRHHHYDRSTPPRRQVNSDKKRSELSWWLFGVAALPLIAGGAMSLYKYSIVEIYDSQPPRQPYVFNWGQAMIERKQLVSKWPPFRDDGNIQRRKKLSINEFRDLYDGKWPVIITDVVPSWGASYWSKEFLYKFYSTANVTVVKGSLSGREGSVMTLGEYYRSSWDETSYNRWQYIMDEHFIYNHPQLLKDIGEMKYGVGDYFDLLPEEIKPKNAMLLWGSKHSRSNLHIDPFNWTGTLALLKGRKKWLEKAHGNTEFQLYPPSQDKELSLESQPSGFPLNCPQYVSKIDAWDPKHKKDLSAWVMEVEQQAGDLLIIPQGWAHQAYNTEETIAISSQYMNRYNYKSVLEEIISCTNISNRLPDCWEKQSPSEQARTVSKLIPAELVATAEKVNSDFRRLLLGED